MQTRKYDITNIILSVCGLATFFLIWHLSISLGLISERTMAKPGEVVSTFIAKLSEVQPDGDTIQNHFLTSFQLSLYGFIAAIVIGTPLGLLMGWYKAIEYFANPIFEIVRPIPPIAWIPIIILLLGIGMPAKAFIIFVSAFVPCVINSYVGVKLTNPVLINVAKTFGASNWHIFKTICIPSAIPMVFAGFRISLGAAWSTLVAAELLASTSGLGYMIQMGRTLIRPDIIIVGMLTIGFTGALMAFVLNRFESKIAPWRAKK
ncbi:NitT/TauT family transport system permease protein [Anaerobacterium chartisolvens]|uniref:NitT/TauT family transport system permease protein n=1 Tax=Anaerobacterium chartisolvens TaxID=1297424 RepID=A0A369BEW3_9FIRM|nr:ABC transporter permease [Anaerobacterium chartisolvens]RCX20083.1 NitT/TauT family transport system permease protein [Anaerobacterium chartisolvens]